MKYRLIACLALLLAACGGGGGGGDQASVPIAGSGETVSAADFELSNANRVVSSLSSDDLRVLVNVEELGNRFADLGNDAKIGLMKEWLGEELNLVIARGEQNLLKTVELAVVSVEDMNEYGSSDEPFELIALINLVPDGDQLVVQTAESNLRALEPALRAITLSLESEDGGVIKDADFLTNYVDTYYLVEGQPQQFFFESLVLSEAVDHNYYIVDQRNLPFKTTARNRYVELFPQAGDAGTYAMRINMYTSENEYIGRHAVNLIVSPPTCEVQTDLNALTIGHSVSTSWPVLFADRMRNLETVDLTMNGTQEFVWRLPGTDESIYEGVFTESSSAFNLYNILRTGENPPGYDPVASKQHVRSPFVFKNEAGDFAVDMARYKRDVLGGKDIDLVIINLGDNDAWGANLETWETRMERVRNDANTLIDHVKELGPDVVVGYMMPLNYSHNQNNWKLDYKGRYDYWEQKQKRHMFIKTIRALEAERGDFSVIPTDFSIDGANDYPNFSALHPPTDPTRDYVEQLVAWSLHHGCAPQ